MYIVYACNVYAMCIIDDRCTLCVRLCAYVVCVLLFVWCDMYVMCSVVWRDVWSDSCSDMCRGMCCCCVVSCVSYCGVAYVRYVYVACSVVCSSHVCCM